MAEKHSSMKKRSEKAEREMAITMKNIRALKEGYD